MLEANNHIKWYSETIYIDVDTGELLNKTTAIEEYIIIKTKKESHVYKTTGNIKYTNECRKSEYKQGRLF